MKQISSLLIVAIATYLLALFFPWWTVVIAPFIAGIFLQTKAWRQFVFGFIAIFLTWGIMAWWAYTDHAEKITIHIGQLFEGLSATALIAMTAIVGGLYGGLAQLTGHFLNRKSIRK